MTDKLILYLEEFVTERRKKLFNTILENRTRYLTVILEDIYQTHNASAVLRSCDCCGIQDVHIVENSNSFQVNPDVTMGSDKWLTLIKHNQETKNTLSALNDLKQQGYRIVATTSHINGKSLGSFDLSKGKAALVFGTEMNGISQYVTGMADEFLKIDMVGFTASYNISVAAAIILYQLSWALRNSDIQWQLSEEEKDEIKFSWLKKSVKDSERIINEYFIRNQTMNSSRK